MQCELTCFKKNLLSNQPTPQITMHELPKPTAENVTAHTDFYFTLS